MRFWGLRCISASCRPLLLLLFPHHVLHWLTRTFWVQLHTMLLHLPIMCPKNISCWCYAFLLYVHVCISLNCKKLYFFELPSFTRLQFLFPLIPCLGRLFSDYSVPNTVSLWQPCCINFSRKLLLLFHVLRLSYYSLYISLPLLACFGSIHIFSFFFAMRKHFC